MKKILAVVLCLLSACLLSACSATVDCFYRADSDYLYYEYRVSVTDGEVAEIERTAASRDGESKWTLGAYLRRLATTCNWTMRSKSEKGKTTYFFNAVIPNEDDDGDESESKTERTVEKGFFYTTVTYTQPHPVAESVRSYQSGTAKENTITHIVKNGYGDLPALEAAFPALKGRTDGITASFYWRSDTVTPVDGEEVEVDGQRYVKWTVKTDADSTISYSYRAVNPVGWYVVIGVIGALTVAVVLIFTKKSKAQPQMVRLESHGHRYHRGARVYYEPPTEQSIYDGEDIFGYSTGKSSARDELEDIFGLSDDDKK